MCVKQDADDCKSNDALKTTSTNELDESELESTERDEIEEIRKQSQKETEKVSTWRILVTLALLATAVIVTATTYKLLVNQEDENFRNVYGQFSQTVADAALEQQANLRDAISMLENSIAISASIAGGGERSPWPYFVPPEYEKLAINFKTIANAEFVSINNLVFDYQRDAYIDYITKHYQRFIQEGHMIAYGDLHYLNNDTSLYQPYIAQKAPNGTFVPDIKREFYFARTLQSPPARKYGPTINNNLIANKVIGDGFAAAIKLGNETVITPIKPFTNLPQDEHKKMHSNGGEDNPHSFTFFPIHRVAGDTSSDIVAMFALATAWDVSMLNLLPENVKGMICVIKNTCNQTVTYRIDGKDALYLGDGDLHEYYDDMALFVDLNLQQHPDARSTPGHCMYSMYIYPSKAFEADYKTHTPAIFAAVIAGTFLVVALVYYIYDTTVQSRNEMMILNAAKSNAIVSSFVPDHLRDRLLQEQGEQQQHALNSKNVAKHSGSLKTFLNDGKHGGPNAKMGKPLADLFLDTTVLFADISGFTAWSSVREPTQVFTLLETLFQAFDRLAKRRHVFKVETVGDCYVAVCGLPEPCEHHAVTMARFGRDIITRMNVLTKELEVTLGPDTGDLALRIGMHSGPVTAGVLRGERTRFQLFGDTMNMCARLEASGKRGHIHSSKETADQIVKAGKASWVEKRTHALTLKGIGNVETYWVYAGISERAGSVTSEFSNDKMPAGNLYSNLQHDIIPGIDEKRQRLILYDVELLTGLMKRIAAQRDSAAAPMLKNKLQGQQSAAGIIHTENTPLEEVKEIIHLPDKIQTMSQNEADAEIPQEVVDELHHLVTTIASMYRDNPFHNFEHASHVVMAVIKLMSRINAPSNLEQLDAASLHDHTYGITSDPLTQFACAFSALIHDVDHVGVSNAQLVKEGVPIAAKYNGRSVAEQNSLDLSWDLLMQPSYNSLRDFLFPSKDELVRFRQLVVNSVMATDIVDKDMKQLRNNRWDKAFKKGDATNHIDENPRDEVNRKATIVIEHIIQAADISHTMQHWHVYRKWNQNLFNELYVAYLNGRMDRDPADFWFNGEFGFFDYYIIPLTQKLKDCGVFGVSSGENLDYALKNRAEWASHGEEVVAEMIKEARAKYGIREAANGTSES